jgi:hypothetical protein
LFKQAEGVDDPVSYDLAQISTLCGFRAKAISIPA